MKYSLVLLALTTSALTAPTKVEERQFPGLGSSGSSGSSDSSQGSNGLSGLSDLMGSSDSSSGTLSIHIAMSMPC